MNQTNSQATDGLASGSGARGEQSLVRALGVWGLAASIVNITVGGGIFRLPASAAAALGAAAPIAYVVCAVAMGLIVLCFAEAGSRVSLTGGIYAYVEVAFGPLAGFLTGVMLWAGLTAALAAVASFFMDSLVALVPALGSPAFRNGFLILVLVSLAVLNMRGVRGANRFNVIITIAKLLPLLLLVVVGVTAVRADNLAWSGTPSGGEVARASAFLIFAFLGVEAALVPSGEVRDPARTVPRAIFLAMAAITVLYLAIHLVTQGILGASLAAEATPLAAAAGVAMGPWGRTLILVGSALSMFGYVGGMTLAVPRMLFAFGRDGFLPARVAAVHPRFRTPHVAIAIQTLLVIALSVGGTFETLAIIANGSILLVYAGCCLAAMELRRRDVRAGGTPFRIPTPGIVPILALAIIAWLLTSLRINEWFAILIVLAVALPVYVIARRGGRGPVVPAEPDSVA